MTTKVIKMGFNKGKKDSRKEFLEDEKKNIRQQMMGRLGDQSFSERKEKSSVIQERLFSSEEFRDAATVLAYVSLPQEVDTEELIHQALKQGKRVGVPYIVPGENRMIASEIETNYRLERGPLGIYQPGRPQVKAISLEEIDLVIVPALAYSRDNTRLGRGKGFYDVFLSSAKKHSLKTIGIAFDFQLVDSLPRTPHDRPVDRVITENN
jgi:5-formyltetrahydrofolate cyclo-ligase